MSAQIAKNGDAIICGHVVRRNGVLILSALFELKQRVIVPEIARYLDGVMTIATITTTLTRLNEKGGLLERTEEKVDVCGTKLKRVFWGLSKGTAQFFTELTENQSKQMT